MKKEKCPECGLLTSDFGKYADSYLCPNGHTFDKMSDGITIIVFESKTGTRFIYSDSAISAISGPGEDDKILTTETIKI